MLNVISSLFVAENRYVIESYMQVMKSWFSTASVIVSETAER